MAIQEVNVGTIANDGTGDDPRTGISKVNSNFTDTTNMASKLAQTSNVDATADRGLLVGAFGLGNTGQLPYPTGLDCDSQVASGSFLLDNSVANNPLVSASQSGTLQHINRLQSSGVVRSTQTARGSGEAWERSDLAGTWSTWEPVYTGASLNPNEFGGGSANLAIATGDAQTTSDVNFFMPISGLAPPTSITVASTFTLQSMQFSTIATGLTPTLSSASGNKLLFLSISGLGGALTVGDRYYLRSDDSSSKITVNF